MKVYQRESTKNFCWNRFLKINYKSIFSLFRSNQNKNNWFHCFRSNKRQASLRQKTLIIIHESRRLRFTAIASRLRIFFIVKYDFKLNQQYVDSFKILKKIDKLTYRLKISNHQRIHSIFIVVQLKFVSLFDENSFNRQRFDHFDSIFVENDIANVKFFEIERLINKRETIKRDFEYLIRWKDYEFQYNEWRNLSELSNAMNLIKKYKKVIHVNIHLSDWLKLFFIDSSSSKNQQQKISLKKCLTLFFFVSSKQKSFSSSSIKKIFDDAIFTSFEFNTTILRKIFTFFITSNKQSFAVVISIRKFFTNTSRSNLSFYRRQSIDLRHRYLFS